MRFKCIIVFGYLFFAFFSAGAQNHFILIQKDSLNQVFFRLNDPIHVHYKGYLNQSFHSFGHLSTVTDSSFFIHLEQSPKLESDPKDIEILFKDVIAFRKYRKYRAIKRFLFFSSVLVGNLFLYQELQSQISTVQSLGISLISTGVLSLLDLYLFPHRVNLQIQEGWKIIYPRKN